VQALRGQIRGQIGAFQGTPGDYFPLEPRFLPLGGVGSNPSLSAKIVLPAEALSSRESSILAQVWPEAAPSAASKRQAYCGHRRAVLPWETDDCWSRFDLVWIGGEIVVFGVST